MKKILIIILFLALMFPLFGQNIKRDTIITKKYLECQLKFVYRDSTINFFTLTESRFSDTDSGSYHKYPVDGDKFMKILKYGYDTLTFPTWEAILDTLSNYISGTGTVDSTVVRGIINDVKIDSSYVLMRDTLDVIETKHHLKDTLQYYPKKPIIIYKTIPVTSRNISVNYGVTMTNPHYSFKMWAWYETTFEGQTSYTYNGSSKPDTTLTGFTCTLNQPTGFLYYEAMDSNSFLTEETGWAETDPIYATDSSFIKTGIRKLEPITYTGIVVSSTKALSVNRTITTLNHHAHDDNTVINISTDQSILGYSSYDTYTNNTSTHSVNHIHGYQSRMNNSGGIIENTAGYTYEYINNGDSLINQVGVGINSPTGTGANKIRNKKALYIGNYAGGYSIYSAGGINYFGGNVMASRFISYNLSPYFMPYYYSQDSGFVNSNIQIILKRININKNWNQIDNIPLNVAGIAGSNDSPIRTAVYGDQNYWCELYANYSNTNTGGVRSGFGNMMKQYNTGDVLLGKYNPLIISATNNVGISTTTPTAKLDVQGLGSANPILIVSNDKDATGDSTFTVTKTGCIQYRGTYAGIYVADASTAQAIATGTTYTKSTAFTTNGSASNCTSDAANDKITITKTGHYLVNCPVSFSAGTSNVVWKMTAFWNNVEQSQIHTTRKISTGGDVGSTTITGILNVTSVPTDLDIRFRHDQGGSENVTVVYSNLTAIYIGE
jgi:hypothetical protein